MSAILNTNSRAWRVAALLLLLAILSLVDLAATLHAMRTTGMFEANPLAAAIARGSSPAALAAFKLASLVFAGAILFALRRCWQAEAAAALCVLLLIGVTLTWILYHTTVRPFDDTTLQAMADPHPAWVKLN
jgi:hypothetical protein